MFDDLCWGPWLQWPSIQSSKYLRPRYWPEWLVHTAARPAGAGPKARAEGGAPKKNRPEPASLRGEGGSNIDGLFRVPRDRDLSGEEEGQGRPLPTSLFSSALSVTAIGVRRSALRRERIGGSARGQKKVPQLYPRRTGGASQLGNLPTEAQFLGQALGFPGGNAPSIEKAYPNSLLGGTLGITVAS